MTGKKSDELTQREKFEAKARELEALHGAVSDDELDAVIGVAGKTGHEGEAEARRQEGLPPANHGHQAD